MVEKLEATVSSPRRKSLPDRPNI